MSSNSCLIFSYIIFQTIADFSLLRYLFLGFQIRTCSSKRQGGIGKINLRQRHHLQSQLSTFMREQLLKAQNPLLSENFVWNSCLNQQVKAVQIFQANLPLRLLGFFFIQVLEIENKLFTQYHLVFSNYRNKDMKSYLNNVCGKFRQNSLTSKYLDWRGKGNLTPSYSIVQHPQKSEK